MTHIAPVVLLAVALAAGIGGCNKFPTRPLNRNPTISSVVAFPLLLGLGDSTLITVSATDPDGDALVYDWEAFNGLVIRDDNSHDGLLFFTPSPSHVFYLTSTFPGVDTAFVFCTVRDSKGGSDTRRVFIPVQQ